MSLPDTRVFSSDSLFDGQGGRSPVTMASLRVRDIVTETRNTRTIRLETGVSWIPRDYPGRAVKVGVPLSGRTVWKMLTISSSPTESQFLDVSLQLTPGDPVANYLFQNVHVGDWLKLAGPQGDFYFDPELHTEPIVLISSGAGIIPMISIARFLEATGNDQPCLMLQSGLSPAHLAFAPECRRLTARLPNFLYVAIVERARAAWSGLRGRLQFETVSDLLDDWYSCRFFISGNSTFVENLVAGLRSAGLASDRIHQEVVR